MITRMLALRLFESFSIIRWTDRIRPMKLTEIDKQGHKAMLTFFLAKFEEEKGADIDWEYLVYGSLFSLMKNIALSDIKAPVMKRIINEFPDEYEKLNNYVIQEFTPLISNKLFLDRFEKFLTEERPDSEINLRILRAAHKYSSYREFEIIKSLNLSFPGTPDDERRLLNDMDKYKDIAGFKELLDKKDLYRASCVIEQLRYQTRWSQTPRIPETSVLGHSMLVACFMIFLSDEVNSCSQRLVNNFYAGLFHDLPESVCRDIISPVKRSTDTLSNIVKMIEGDVCDSELFPNFPEGITNRLKYLCSMDSDDGDEFSDRVMLNGKKAVLEKELAINEYNNQEFDPIDGRLLKLADEIAAFLEAEQSIYHGITSRHLQEGMTSIKSKYMKKKSINGVDVQEFFLGFI